MSKLLDRYFKENFFLIPIRKNDKRPLYKKWNQNQLSYMEAQRFIKEGYNLGVVAKDLWILDYDESPKQWFDKYYFRHMRTLVQFTPRGYHVFYKGDVARYYEVTNQERAPFDCLPLEEPDTIRHGDMYCLIAPSKVDGKSYWWLDNMKGEILTI